MGVGGFYYWLKNKRWRSVLIRSVPRNVSSFSLDMNGIIHNVAQTVYAYGKMTEEKIARAKLVARTDPKLLEAEFHNTLGTKLLEVIAQVRPQEILVLAVDGVAPQAKISQQRQRRFKAAMERGETQVIFDSNSITPGTEFMRNLDSYLQRWIVSNQQKLPRKIIYSSHMVPGEGEHKILEFMRAGEIVGNGAHVLYGMDADLIMLTMLAPIDKIFLMRENERDVINIDNMKYNVEKEYGGQTAIADFVLMTFMIGNDFLPHMPALEDLSEAMENMLRTYKKTNLSLVLNGEIIWQNLALYLTNFAQLESEMLDTESKRDFKYPSRMLAAATTKTQRIEERSGMDIGAKVVFTSKFDYNIFRGAWYQNALGLRGSAEDKAVFTKLLPGYSFGPQTDKVISMTIDYLSGIAWVYGYYSKGIIHINSSFIYRYHHTPLLTDLANVLSQVGTVTGYEAVGEQLPINPVYQLLAVLPLKSKNLLPREVAHLMTKDSPISDMYPQTAIIERDGKNQDYQGTVIIPFVDIDRITEAVNTTSIFSAERARLFAPANNVTLLVTKEMEDIITSRRNFQQKIAQEKAKRYRGRPGGRGGSGRGGSGRGGSGRGGSGRGRSRTVRK